MGKASRHKRGGRTTPKGTKPQLTRRRGHQHQAPNLADDARRAVRDASPLSLLAMASGIVELCTPRPLDSVHGRTGIPNLLDTIHSFVHASPDLTAVAAVAARLITDEALSRDILTDVAGARLPAYLPAWFDQMDEAVAAKVLKMTHPYGDGDDFIIGVRWPSGAEVSAVIYIDHNMSSIVKDAFLLPDGPEGLTERFAELADAHVTLEATDAADARAKIAEAITKFEISLGVENKESWPAARSVIEWMIAKLPAGGAGYSVEPISDAEEEEILDEFLDSEFAATLSVPVESIRSLTQPLIWFAHDYVGGDALRCSPITVEILLSDWYARKVFRPAEEMAELPSVLAAWVRHTADKRRIAADLLDDTLAAIEEFTPDYFVAIRDPKRSRERNAMMLARMAAGLPLDDDDDDDDDDEFIDDAYDGDLIDVDDETASEEPTDQDG